ncbi:MAG TPA: biotin/lipoyl-binding protein, partial [Candidatus Scatomorpha stercorigallinarum]|nr:biotin/lipoyl-binding protein [Candidatus Scatomorpha stercorigallinarum]
APAPVAPAGGETVDSPLPGKVLSVAVSAGQAVKAGQVMLVIEAMKMENEILAPRDCTVKQLLVSAGTPVESGTPLAVIG